MNPQLQSDLRKLLGSGAFLAMACSPVCASFSTAITPPWRTCEYPAGRPDLTELQNVKIRLGQQQLEFTLALVRICIEVKVIFWVENPDSSWFWRQKGKLSWDRILATPGVGLFRCDQCRYNTRRRKRTRFFTNCHLAGQKVLCRCTEPHVVLRGRCKEKAMNYTKLAEAYPRKLCEELSAAVGIDAGLYPKFRKLAVSDCARCGHSRIGEAANPGPRARRNALVPRAGNLDDIEMLQPATVAMRKKFWTAFTEWLDEELGEGALDSCLTSPALMVRALESYGNKEFSAGTPLHYYRQLLAHVQRTYPMVRSFMPSAWALVSKWEIAEPVQHRAPLPKPLMQAMVGLGLLWDWPLFSACLALCFHGICRIGEVLAARRSDLLTPTDLLAEEAVIYLRIRKPKTRGRGPKVQYSTVRDPDMVAFLSVVWQDFPRDSFLYPASAGTFRRRWDSILAHLGVPVWHRLTPGSLRAGGCVAAHISGLQIQDLLWAMRLQHTKTLCYYLQETTAESILPALSDTCRSNILALRATLPFLLKSTAERTGSVVFNS